MDTKQQTAVMERRFWKRLCALNRFSFFVLAGGVARAADKAGNWIEAHSAQEIVDDAECEVSALKQRIADLEARLEVDARHPYDGIACRDATIAELQAGYTAARLEIESLQKAATDRHALQATGAHPAPCARYCEAVAFNIERRNLHAENEQLRTCNKDAQHEIANLQERVQELGQMARDVNSRRVVELEAQLEAVGEGGVGKLAVAHPTQDRAVERDELLQAAINFIQTLTGMTPPPIEVAPPEVFAPFRAFVEKIQEITDRRCAASVEPLRKRECLHQISEPAQPVAQAQDAARYQFLRDGEWRDTELEPFIRLQLNTMWDAKIDAAIAAQKGEKS